MPPVKAPRKVSLKTAFYYWLKLGFTSFGGSTGQIGMMHQELVLKRRWISERRFLHALNFCMVIPGSEAQQLATYIGWLMHGVFGGIMAGVLFILPSLLILTALSWVYMTQGELPAIHGFLYGVKPAVVSIVLFAAYRIGSRALKNKILGLIAACALLASSANLPFPVIILTAGLLGFIGSDALPEAFKADLQNEGSTVKSEAALIGDYTPLPNHAQSSRLRSGAFAICGLGLWSAVMAYLYLNFGLEGTLTQMAWFFSQAAMLAFGGAYAVLPYFYQGSVEIYGWLDVQQMIDGLALSEATPGPRIMIVALIGFIGGWSEQFLGSESLLSAGIAGACTAVFFTFLPSFLLIFIGGPWIEASRNELKLTAPWVSIGAAVAGVIIHLAAFFAYLMLWPHGFSENFDLYAATLSGLALVALFKYKMNAVPVILACGLAGLFH